MGTHTFSGSGHPHWKRCASPYYQVQIRHHEVPELPASPLR
jgi:hypothetical protein